MDKKDTAVSVIGIITTGVIMFFVGTMYTDVKNSQLQYQVKLKVSAAAFTDSIMVYDGKRHVGTVPLNYKEPFALLILNDNE